MSEVVKKQKKNIGMKLTRSELSKDYRFRKMKDLLDVFVGDSENEVAKAAIIEIDEFCNFDDMMIVENIFNRADGYFRHYGRSAKNLTMFSFRRKIDWDFSDEIIGGKYCETAEDYFKGVDLLIIKDIQIVSDTTLSEFDFISDVIAHRMANNKVTLLSVWKDSGTPYSKFCKCKKFNDILEYIEKINKTQENDDAREF